MIIMKYLEVGISDNIFSICSIKKEWFNNIGLMESEEEEENE
jgi:hypothetical protein